MQIAGCMMILRWWSLVLKELQRKNRYQKKEKTYLKEDVEIFVYSLVVPQRSFFISSLKREKRKERDQLSLLPM